MKCYRKQKGFSLIEMLIAMAISSVLCLSAYKAYYLIAPQLGYQSNLIHLQQNIRLIDTLLGSPLKFKAGLGIEIIKDSSDLPLMMESPPDSTAVFHQQIKDNTPILKIVHAIEPESLYFFIKNTKRLNVKGEPLYSLYQYSRAHSSAELLEGVEAVQYFVGIPNEKGITFFPYAEVQDKTQIKMLRIQLQFVSLDKKIQKTHTQDFTLGNIAG